MNNIFIIGHYGGDNFGDEAMLDVLIERLLRDSSERKIIFVTKKPNAYSYNHPNVEPIAYGLKGIIKAFLICNTLLLGGGTHFHDDYSAVRYKNHFYYLVKILLISILFRIKFGKVYFLGVGYGPLLRRSAKILSKISCLVANQIVVRDNDSYHIVESLIGNSKKLILAGDLALLSSKYQPQQSDSQRNIIGVSLTSFSFSSLKINDNIWNDELFPAFEEIYKNEKVEFLLFVFRGGIKESDFDLTSALFQRLSKIDNQRVKIIDFTYDIEFFISEIGKCNYFVATRFHSAVLSYFSNCNVSIIPYHRKLLSFAREMNIQSKVLKFESVDLFISNLFEKEPSKKDTENTLVWNREQYEKVFTRI